MFCFKNILLIWNIFCPSLKWRSVMKIEPERWNRMAVSSIIHRTECTPNCRDGDPWVLVHKTSARLYAALQFVRNQTESQWVYCDSRPLTDRRAADCRVTVVVVLKTAVYCECGAVSPDDEASLGPFAMCSSVEFASSSNALETRQDPDRKKSAFSVLHLLELETFTLPTLMIKHLLENKSF